MDLYVDQKARRSDWLAQVFDCRAAQIGGVIRRQIVDVEREIGTNTLVAAVRRRNFRLIRTAHYYVIVCHDGPIELVC